MSAQATGRTQAQIEAAERDGRWCMWHKIMLGVLQEVTDVHHIFGRARADTKETCISLCHTCHMLHHSQRIPSTRNFVDLLIREYGYDFSQYTQFMKK